MSTTKTVKVTNGKVVNYTVTKPGFKPVHGSKLITADTTINVSLIADSDTRDVYALGDRIGGVATFFTYYTDGEGNKYAVFVVDARYRVNSVQWGTSSESSPGIFLSKSAPTTEASCPLSATTIAQHIFTTFYPEGSTANPYPVFKAAQDSVQIPELGTAGVGRVPNAYELQRIFDMRNSLDQYDPTVADYPLNSLAYWHINNNNAHAGAVWCANLYQYWDDQQYSTRNAFALGSDGGWYTTQDYYNLASSRPMIPVIELKVN